jgi:DNA polymerase III delta prime subunit
MKPIISLSELPDHHAVLVVSGERDAVRVTLFEELQRISPVHRLFDQTVLDIDTARNIISWANTPYNDEKIALITFHIATIPAQNAMLKVLEEPKAGVKFILLTSNKEHLLETVLSRVESIETQGINSEEKDNRAVTFLATKHSERMKLAFVAQLLLSEDEEGRKDREKVRGFILSLSQVLSEKNAEPKYILETIEVASYAGDSSASGKALIEYLSLLLPVIKD